MVKTDNTSTKKPTQRFPKEEKLCSKRDIDELFREGSSHFLYPFRLIFLSTDTSKTSPKVVISVPKKQFRKAIDRNRIKRKIREAYRKNKFRIFCESAKIQVPKYLAIVYIGKEEYDYAEIEQKLISILLRLKNTEKF